MPFDMVRKMYDCESKEGILIFKVWNVFFSYRNEKIPFLSYTGVEYQRRGIQTTRAIWDVMGYHRKIGCRRRKVY